MITKMLIAAMLIATIGESAFGSAFQCGKNVFVNFKDPEIAVNENGHQGVFHDKIKSAAGRETYVGTLSGSNEQIKLVVPKALATKIHVKIGDASYTCRHMGM